MKFHYFPQDLVFQKAAKFLLTLLRTHQNEKVLLFLSGGSVVKLYEGIRNQELGIRNGNLAIAQIDERFKPENKEDSNAVAIEKTGLLEVCKKKNIPYDLISQEGTLEQAADKYNRKLEELFEKYTYKIAVLGIGEDGHTAGLLPGYEKEWNVDTWVLGYESSGEFRQRITVTPKALQQLNQAVVVAAGERKKEAIKSALNPSNTNNINKYPAAILQKIKRVDLFTDVGLPRRSRRA